MKEIEFGLCFALLLCCAHGANILAIFNAPAYSHFILAVKLLRPLAERGHNIIIASPFTLSNPPQRWKEIVFHEVEKNLNEGGQIFYKMSKMNEYEKDIVGNLFGVELTSNFMNHPSFITLLNIEEKIDLIILERFMNEALLGISYHFNAPFIYLSTMGHSRWTNSIVGNPGSPAYVPDLFLDYSCNMDLLKRFYNTFFYCFTHVFHYFFIFPKHQKLLEEHFPGAPKLEELYYNASLLFLNTHLGIKYAAPTVPNLIEIGGYHIDPPKNLSNELHEFLDNSSDGVIYFSLGSAIKSKDMDVNVRDDILKTFSQLKQNVLWKWESDNDFDLPKNVKLSKWLPQQDILAHSNIKLFITHGGLLSCIEAVHYGVPLLALPFFAEQFMNAVEIQDYGYGLYLPFNKFDNNKFKDLIIEAISNQKYKNNVMHRSKVFRDQLASPKEKAIFWIEYVIRHKGAHHLKSVTLNLKWYQYLLLDVIMLAVLILLTLFITFKCCLGRLMKFIKRQENGDKKFN